VPLQVAAAQATLQSEESNLTLARRNVLAQPIFQAGVEYGDPTQPFLLPTFGFSIPLPLFNRNGGEIALASATRDRAMAELDVARRQSAAEVAQAKRELHIAMTRADRDRQLLQAAQRVVAGSLTAFAEGATALPSVLEAQRSARDALGQYVDDLAEANMAADAVRLFNLSAPSR
jgi:cobalt-zinc-cadmium efflux system outer membrane protein